MYYEEIIIIITIVIINLFILRCNYVHYKV